MDGPIQKAVKAVGRIAAVLALLIALTAPAGASANDYTPNGTIIAESGFRPDANGYSFENYTNEGNPQNLDAAAMQKLFGGAVCMGGGDDSGCTLTPAAKEWKDAQNKGMGGGHCEGLAVTASLFYAGLGEPPTPSPFGSATVPGLGFDGNSALQAHIAYGYVFQALRSVSTTKVNSSPEAVLAALSAGLPSHEPMVLGVYKRGFVGGHAITPLAVEDRGDGKFAVLVYDNNFPNKIREVDIDQNANTWNYKASTNPGEQADLYEGDATTKTLEVEYARNGLGTQPCPFCRGNDAAQRRVARRLNKDEPEAQLFWNGDARDGHHSDVTITDEDGNTAGCTGSGDDRDCTDDIPGVELVPQKLDDGGVDVWNESAPPLFDLADDLDFEVDLDGSSLDSGADEGFSLVRRKVSFELSDLEIDEGDQQSVQITGKGLEMDNGSDHEIGPSIGYGNQSGDQGFEVTLQTSGLDPDSALGVDLRPGRKRLEVDFNSADSDEAQVTAVVKRLDDGGDDDTARTGMQSIDGGQTFTVSYGSKAFRDGRLDFDQRGGKHRE